MNNSRRHFVKALSAAGAFSGLAWTSDKSIPTPDLEQKLKELDEAVNQPVLRKQFFDLPVIIADVQLLHHRGSFICRVISKDGAEGICVCNNLRMEYLYPIFLKRVAPFFINKDARDLDSLIKEVYKYKSNYKMQGYALGVPIAAVEFAILDLLGKMAKLPMGELLGDVVNKEVPIYLATRFREKSAEYSIEEAKKQVAEGGYSAVKFKIGSKMGENKELISGRTDKLIPLARKEFGDETWLGVDANGAYDIKEAIRVGKILEENNYGFYEEPVPFDWYRETAEISSHLKIPIAGGEQEPSLRNFRWMVAEKSLKVYRPDMFYFGGMIRSVKVARMANVSGYKVVPHLSGSGLGYLYALHFISSIPNPGDFHPNSRDKNLIIPIECKTSSLEVKNGKVKVPTGPGLGVEVDPSFLGKHVSVSAL